MWRTNFKFMTYVTKTWQDTGNEQPSRIAAAILVLPPSPIEYEKLIRVQLFAYKCTHSESVQGGFDNKVVTFQLMVDGVTLKTGQSAQ